MSAKRFKCKVEEVPVLGGFVVNSAEKDIDDFNRLHHCSTAEKNKRRMRSCDFAYIAKHFAP
jgi:hypothetical protein